MLGPSSRAHVKNFLQWNEPYIFFSVIPNKGNKKMSRNETQALMNSPGDLIFRYSISPCSSPLQEAGMY